MRNLHLYSTNEIDELAWPDKPASYTLNTPATKFISDFSQITPMVIDSVTSADELKSFMIHAHIRLVSVLDSKNHFIGIVSLSELSDQRLIRKQVEGYYRNEIKVSDIMVKRKDLPAFDTEEIKNSTIGDVVDAMKNHYCKYSLVLDRHTHRIRGIFAADELSAKLKLPIEVRDPRSFYRVFAPVSNSNLKLAAS